MDHALHDDVLDQLGRLIVDGELAAGTVLTAADLEQRFDVSRTVVRETVRVLESMGMVASRRRVGLTVMPATHWNALDRSLIAWRLAGPGRDEQLRSLIELRSAVEPAAARLTAERASAEVGRRLVELAGVLARLGEQGLGDSPEYLEADVEYHSLLLDSCGNDMFAALKEPVVQVLTWRSTAGLTPADPNTRAVQGHVEMAAAVARRDAAAAEHHARGYVTTVAQEVASSPPPPVE